MQSLRRALMVLALVLSACGYASAAPQDPREELSQAIERRSRGRFDEALVLFKSAVQHAAQQGDRLTTVSALLEMADLMRKMGRSQEATKALDGCIPLAQGTELEGACTLSLDLLRVETRVEGSTDLSGLLDLLQRILTVEKLSLTKAPASWRDSVKSRALTQRIYIHLQFLKVLGSELDGKSVKALSPPLQIFLVAATQDIPPKNLDPHPESRKTQLRNSLLAKMDPKIHADKALLKKTLDLNSALMNLDKGNPLYRAIDISQRSDIHAKLGNTLQAIALKREVVGLFYQYGSYEDIVNALYRLTDLYLAVNSPVSRLKALELVKKQVAEIENQVLAMSGESAGLFLKHSQNIYDRYFNLLLERYRDQYSAALPEAEQTLEDLLLQADRMNFRAVRRNLAFYRELGEQIGPESELVQRLSRQSEKVEALKQEVIRMRSAGQEPYEWDISLNGQEFQGPLTAVRSAKRGLIEILEDYKRRQLENQTQAIRLPSSLSQVLDGMSANEAIVMFMQRPSSEAGISAAIVTTGNPIRWVPDLRDSDGKAPGDLIGQFYDPLDLASPLESPDMKDVLERLSKTLWHPLGDLPENLTIILTPDLIGIPFESLLLKNGQPVISAHRIRYAFGLEPRIGVTHERQAYRSALVAGATIENLNKKEVEGLQGLLRKHQVTVSPNEGMPAEGRPLFHKAARSDLVHISTHSDTDEDLPMVDALKFPRDKVFAYELAFSPVRAELMVLSACKLFSARGSDLDPVSGITTAVMARVAPQVISALWDVNPEATRVFMLRFYDALLEYQEPSTALAATKRDFLDPEKLSQWVKSAGIEPSVIPIDEYRAPYYWAPFVLVISSGR